jgi:hypothetical protein
MSQIFYNLLMHQQILSSSFFEAIFYTKSNRIRAEVDFVDTSYQILSVCSVCVTVIETETFLPLFLSPLILFSI